MLFQQSVNKIKIIKICIYLIVLALIFKVGYIQIIDRKNIYDKALESWQRSFPVQANRGKIYDRSSRTTLLHPGDRLYFTNIYCGRQTGISSHHRRESAQACLCESDRKPVYAKDETGKYLAYLRIKDENILATPIHLRVWQQSGSPRGELIRYTEREQLLLDLLEQGTLLSLNRYCRQTGISRRAAEHLLAKFVRYDIVEPVFENHKFYFRMKNE